MKIMLTLILLVILSNGWRVDTLDLNTVFKSFLTSSLTSRMLHENPIAMQNLFKLYKNEFSRSSVSLIEEKIRYASFNDTLIALLKDYQQGERTYTVELNKYADWTLEELSNLCGLRKPQGEIIDTNAKFNQRFLTLNGKGIQSNAIALPTLYDYTARVITGTNTSIIRPIKDQGECGSCYAFAFITLLEVQYAFQLRNSTSLSEQQIVDCSFRDYGCDGGYFTRTFYYFTNNTWQVNGGISYPYKQEAATCAFKNIRGGGVNFGSLLYRRLPVKNAIAMQAALINYGPLWVSLFVGGRTNTAYQSVLRVFSSYASGIIQPSGCLTSNFTANHAVVIVGYGIDVTTKIPFWKVRNSWGTNWGEKGYFRIQRGVNMCGIESDGFYIGKPA